jgi:uncharacterized protein (TIGR03067 family)
MALASFVLIAAAAPREATDSDDMKKMQGDWMVVSMTANGMKYPDEEAQALFRTVDGNSYQVSRYSKAMVKGTFKIDPAATPKTIDSSLATDPSKALLGIYEFEGAMLKVCNAPPGKPRPTAFEAKAGSGHTLTVWQPEK